MANPSPELLAHREWLGQIQQVGLVVAPQVLVDRGVFVDRQKGVEVQTRLRELFVDADEPRVADLAQLARDVLGWPDGTLVTTDLPAQLTISLPEYEDVLSPSAALRSPDSSSDWLALVSIVPAGTPMDKAPDGHAGWRATPHARLERLLRDTNIPIGLLFNGTALRLIYAPRGESSGHLTFRFAHVVETQGRPMAAALHALVGVDRITDRGLEQERLPFLLRESRKYQNEVSTELAGQVLEALWELLRGVQRANEHRQGELLAEVLREQPGDVYGGLLTTLMRLVFILYAEDRGLMPASEVYQRHYGVSGLFERLRDDLARNNALDRAVLDAYGWTDIRPTCDFFLDYEDEEDDGPGKASKRKKPWRYRWPDHVRDEVLGRLLELNTQRADEERAQPVSIPPRTAKKRKPRGKQTETLLLNESDEDATDNPR